MTEQAVKPIPQQCPECSAQMADDGVNCWCEDGDCIFDGYVSFSTGKTDREHINWRTSMNEFTAADATAESIADAMETLEQMPKSREASLVKTKLEEAQMWLRSAAPTRNEANG